MSTNNILLGHGGPPVAEQAPRKRQVGQSIPAWLYHRDCEAKIFYTLEAFNQAKSEGWVDSPAKVNDPFHLQGKHEAEEAQPDQQRGTVTWGLAFSVEDPGAAQAPEAEQKPETVETMPEVFTCDVCGKEFEKKQALAAHKLSHRAKA